MAIFELIASLPPFNIEQLPDLKHNPNASDVTFGRASNIIPITPRGTLLFPIINPLGLFFMERTSPIGSSNLAICTRPSAICSILSDVNVRRSRSPAGIRFSLPCCTSILFASIIVS